MSYLKDFENKLLAMQPLWDAWYVDERIGEGSQSVVYRLKRSEIDGAEYCCALKIVSLPANETELQNIWSMKKDLREAKEIVRDIMLELTKEISIMYELKGLTNIVSYEDHQIIAVEDGKRYYILIRMELLTNFISVLREREQFPITEKDVIKLGIDICSALEICHKHNIVHRDVKPDNLFLSRQGNYKLGDFGVSRKLNQTMLVSTKGTYSYMAPEVFHNKASNIKADIYSLGVVMYQLLNENRFPLLLQDYRYGDIEKAVFARLTGADLPLPANAQNELGRLVLKACAYAQKDRFKNPSEMKQALASLLVDKNDKTSISRKKAAAYSSLRALSIGAVFLTVSFFVPLEIVPEPLEVIGSNHVITGVATPQPASPDTDIEAADLPVREESSDEPPANKIETPKPASVVQTAHEVHEAPEAMLPIESVPLSAPQGLKTQQYGSESSRIFWEPVSGATSYEAEFFDRESGSWKSDPDYLTNTELSYISAGLDLYDSYKYRIRAVNSDGVSKWSEAVFFKINAIERNREK